MSIKFDEKGKFFTDVVTKEAVHATIQTTTHLIQGQIHIRHNVRLKDELDLDEPFLAVTNAEVRPPDGQVVYTTDFIAIQRGQIVWIIANENLAATSEAS